MSEPTIIEQSIKGLRKYMSIPASFEVRSIFDIHVIDQGLGGFSFSMRKVETPYIKNYDAFNKNGLPEWSQQWNISNWGILSAFHGDTRIGGCVIAHDTPDVNKLEGRKDIAALWDLRVHPDFRQQGIGTRLIHAGEAWAMKRDCRLVKIETQNINLPACRLYAKHGYILRYIDQHAYDDFPDEVELVWYKEL